MKQDRLINNTPEQVIIFPGDRRIRIDEAVPFKAYGLFDSETGEQIGDFVKGDGGQIEFNRLNPSKHYDVGAVENIGDEKPYFHIAWTLPMRDDTDEILGNSDNLPVAYPADYRITDKGKGGVSDLEDAQGEKVGQVIKLSGDKPEIVHIWSMKMKDDTKE